jgi:hypothetical protein
MHLDVVSDLPGICPKCGMALVEVGSKPKMHHHDDKGLGVLSFKSYVPLFVIISLIVIASYAALFGSLFTFTGFIVNFMTGFFLVFAGFKLMDIKGFAEGYATYDILASRIKVYGYVYPFIELVFGLFMLAGYHPAWLLWTELCVMIFSGLGVAIKLAKRESFMCVSWHFPKSAAHLCHPY